MSKCIEQTSVFYSPRKFNTLFSGLMSSTSSPLIPQFLANNLPFPPKKDASVSEFFVHVPWFSSHFKDRSILASTCSQPSPGPFHVPPWTPTCSGRDPSLLYCQHLTLCEVISNSFTGLTHAWYDLSKILDLFWSHLNRTSISNLTLHDAIPSIATASNVFVLADFGWIFVATIEWNTLIKVGNDLYLLKLYQWVICSWSHPTIQ